MDEISGAPDLLTIKSHIDSVRFQAGVERGRWSVLRLSWPYLFVRIVGADPATDHQFEHDFRLECRGFPDPGPFVERWAFDRSPSGGKRPDPPQNGSPAFIDALKEWGAGAEGGIYRAWQRGAASHNDWARKRPDEAWHRKRHLIFVMEHLYALVSEQAAWLATHT